MKKRITFEIETMDEPAAGIIGAYDQVSLEIESGDPGGEEGEFEEYMRRSLLDWYDGGKITKL